MQTINIHQAKTQLSKLVDQAVKGESFIIAKAGKPLVKVIRIEQDENSSQKRLGFMMGQVSTPDDFDNMGQSEISKLFGGE